MAGLSTGMRAFSAIATMIRETSASPSDTRNPTSGEAMTATMVESWVEPATNATVNTIMIIAGFVVLFVLEGDSRWDLWAMLVGSGLAVLLLNVLFRYGAKGDDVLVGSETARTTSLTVPP